MTVIVTRMPSTGEVTNVTESADAVTLVTAWWADTDCVQVLSDAQFAALPRCQTCGEWVGFRRCADCR